MVLKLKSVINDILVVSKVTNTSKKKLKISLSILLANISALIDSVEKQLVEKGEPEKLLLRVR